MTTAQIDTDKLMAFVFRAVDEVGATLNCALVHMGDQLGYYRDLAEHGPTTPEELAVAHRHRPAVRPRMAQRPGRGPVRRVRPGDRAVHPAARARGGADRREQPGVPARLLPDRARHGAGLPPDRRGGTDGRRARLARAQRRRARGLRAVLPAGVRREPGGCVAAGTGRGRREARGRRPRRRRRVRSRGLHGADGAGLPALDVHGLGLPRRVGGDGPRPGGRGRGR